MTYECEDGAWSYQTTLPMWALEERSEVQGVVEVEEPE